MHIFGHLRTITKHHNRVMKYCFKCGLYFQGFFHDLSKLSFPEFFNGAKYYTGTRSPHFKEREAKGYSEAWMHHKGRNKHHLEYWIDYAVPKPGEDIHTPMEGMKMPIKYVCEMFIDRVSASKNYQKEKYTDSSALIYYQKSVAHYMIHEDTKALLEYLLVMLSVKGEDYTYSYIKNEVLKGKVPYEKKSLNKLEERLHV